MKISATKPHFFKPIVQGFENGLKIPMYFAKYVLETPKRCPNEALLKKKGKEWRVEVTNDCFVGDGWVRFAEENKLKLSDFVVFKHHGNMVFDVLVFDGVTQCKKEQDTNGDPRFEASTSKKAVAEEIGSDDGEEEEKARPHFIAAISHSNTHYGWLSMTVEFARSNGLFDRNGEIIVKDEQGKSWYFDLRTSNSCHVRIHRGPKLAEFLAANGFKKGDWYKFEVVKVAENRDEMPVVRFLPAQVNACPGHIYTARIKAYSYGRKAFLLIPMEFAQRNGLCKKREMVLEDKEGRRWQVDVRFYQNRLRIISDGWRKFIGGNSIKVGDAYKFEIFENAAVPVVRFTVNDAA